MVNRPCRLCWARIEKIKRKWAFYLKFWLKQLLRRLARASTGLRLRFGCNNCAVTSMWHGVARLSTCWNMLAPSQGLATTVTYEVPLVDLINQRARILLSEKLTELRVLGENLQRKHKSEGLLLTKREAYFNLICVCSASLARAHSSW